MRIKNLNWFLYIEKNRAATDKFDSTKKIAEGGFGIGFVYKVCFTIFVSPFLFGFVFQEIVHKCLDTQITNFLCLEC